MLDEECVKAMKVVELKAELAKYGLPQTGKKDELVERLLDHLNSVPDGSHPNGNPVEPAANTNNVAGDENTVVSAEAAAALTPITSIMDDEESRRAARAARFGLSHTPSTSTAAATASGKSKLKHISKEIDASQLSSEAKQRRIERFGLVSSSGTTTSPSSSNTKVSKKALGGGAVEVDWDRLKARQERFGSVTSTALARKEAEEARLRRLERFGKQQ